MTKKWWFAVAAGIALLIHGKKRILTDAEKSWLERVNAAGRHREPEWTARDREYCERVQDRMRDGYTCVHPPLFR